MAFHEVVGPPLQDVEEVKPLVRLDIRGFVFHAAPGEHGEAEGHGQTKLHMVARIVKAAGEVETDVAAIVEGGVASPRDAENLWQIPAALGVEEVEGLLEGLGVVETAGHRLAKTGWRSVVVAQCQAGGACGDRCARGIAELDVEVLVGFLQGVCEDFDEDWLFCASCGKNERAAGGVVVESCERGVVLRGPVHGDWRRQ